jgi:hypothetical protein
MQAYNEQRQLVEQQKAQVEQQLSPEDQKKAVKDFYARLDAEAMTGNNNQSQAVNYRWRKEGDITTIPRAMHGNSNYNTLVSDRFVEDGSYLRMSYVQVNYDLPQRYLKGIGLKRLGFYASANNIFVLTKYSGVDPDISGGEGPAVDRAQTPRSRSFTLGVSVDF